MKSRLKYLFLLLTLSAQAQEPVRPVSSAWSVEMGSAHLADTYLSPVKYSGMHFGVGYRRLQALRRTHLVQGWNMGVSFDRANNPAGNSTMLAARVDGAWRMLRRWHLPEGFQVGAGGYVGAELGALYLSRNGNNPVQAQAALNLGPEIFGQWRKDIFTVRLTAATPLLGTFFCPDYGELYYEIALGNHSDLAHFGWLGNYRQLLLHVDFDINLGNTTLRLGYKFNGLSTKANNITSRRMEHSAVIGIVSDFLTVNPRHAKVVTAY